VEQLLLDLWPAAEPPAKPVPQIDYEVQDDLTDPDELPPFVHRWVRAADAPALRSIGVASIWDAARCPVHTQMRQRPEREPTSERRRREREVHTVVQREAGRVVCRRILAQETEEWQAREAARRARQVVPKPSKRNRTRGAKLLEMIGGGHIEADDGA
jgi:hypothetical protein